MSGALKITKDVFAGTCGETPNGRAWGGGEREKDLGLVGRSSLRLSFERPLASLGAGLGRRRAVAADGPSGSKSSWPL